MGYYLRFFVTDLKNLSLSDLDVALKTVDPCFGILISGDEGELQHHGEIYGEIEINRPGGGLFEEEVDESIEMIEDTRSPARDAVVRALRQARLTIALRVLWQERQTEATLEKIDPLWRWLLASREGLLHADGEGYYDRSGLVLATD